MNDGDNDLDTALFGSDPGASDLPFPFGPTPEPGYEPGDSSLDGDNHSPAYDSNEYGVIRYGRFNDQADEGAAEDFRDSIPGSGARVRSITGADEQRDREAADTGDRHIGRVADARTGVDSTGAAGGSDTRVANSLREASDRIRGTIDSVVDSRIPYLDNSDITVDTATIKRNIPKRHYERSNISEPPKFQHAEFESTIVGLKANVNGEWIVTFRVDPQWDEQVIQLKSSFGLALMQTIDRRQRGHGND